MPLYVFDWHTNSYDDLAINASNAFHQAGFLAPSSSTTGPCTLPTSSIAISPPSTTSCSTTPALLEINMFVLVLKSTARLLLSYDNETTNETQNYDDS